MHPPPPPLLPSSLLPPSPAQNCSIWEGLLGLASLQCRKGQGGCFSTMRWRMVHQEKRVYQVCGFLFACVGDPEGVAYLGIIFRGFSQWQISIMLMKQPRTDVWLLGGMCLFGCHLYRVISVFLHVRSTLWNSIILCLHVTFIVRFYSHRPQSHITMSEWALPLVQLTASSVSRPETQVKKNYSKKKIFFLFCLIYSDNKALLKCNTPQCVSWRQSLGWASGPFNSDLCSYITASSDDASQEMG